MQRIYLIRHGQTVANQQNLCCGKSDVPLSPEGLSALRKLAAGGGYPDPEGKRLITSGMQRTEQTLEVLFGTREHEVEPAFREMDYGIFELQSYDQLKEREDYQQWQSGDRAATAAPAAKAARTWPTGCVRPLTPFCPMAGMPLW